MDESWRADAVRQAEGSIGGAVEAWRADPAGVEEQGTRTEGPQEPGRPCRFRRARCRCGRPPATNSPGPRRAARGRRGSERRGAARYRRAKETKRGGRTAGSRSALVVPMKPGNRPEGPRGGKGAPGHGTAGGKDDGRHRSPRTVSTKLQRIAELAREDAGAGFTTLAHHIDIDWLREAYGARGRTERRAWTDRRRSEYASDLEDEPPDRCSSASSPDVLRAAGAAGVHPEGRRRETRPIGIPTFEDKVLQRAVAMVLEAVYEQDFLDCSYGFRPGRSAHRRWRPCGEA